MSTIKYVKGFCIGRQTDCKILYQISRVPSENTEQNEKEITQHIQNYLKDDEEQKSYEINKTYQIIANEGMYCTLIDDKKIVYTTLVNEVYPFNQVQLMLNTIKKELKNMPNYEKQSDKTIQNFAKGFIVQIIDNFDSEQIVQDAIKIFSHKQIEIEDIHAQIEQNLKQINTDHSNPSNFSTADQKLSPELEKLRQQQESNKEDQKAKTKEQNQLENQQLQKKQLKNAVAVRNLKIKIIVAIVIISIVLYAVIPLF
ncbi:hypothetical protein ABPG74_011814 [Tetrahymena malaccensis]